jgi:hypothetical protein
MRTKHPTSHCAPIVLLVAAWLVSCGAGDTGGTGGGARAGAAGAAGAGGASGGSSVGGWGGAAGQTLCAATAGCPSDGPPPDCGNGAACRFGGSVIAPAYWECIPLGPCLNDGSLVCCVWQLSELTAQSCNRNLSQVGDYFTGESCCAPVCVAAGVQ